MEIKEGMFARIKTKEGVQVLFVIEVMYFEKVIYHVTAESLDPVFYFHCAYYTNQILETWHDTTHPHYINWLKEKNTPPKTIKKTTVIWDWDAGEKSKGKRGE